MPSDDSPLTLDEAEPLLEGTLRELGAAIWSSGDLHGYWNDDEASMTLTDY